MKIIILYIISAFSVYNFAYILIRKIDKKERKKLNNWEYTTLKEVKEILGDIYKEIPENITLGAIISYIEDKKKDIDVK